MDTLNVVVIKGHQESLKVIEQIDLTIWLLLGMTFLIVIFFIVVSSIILYKCISNYHEYKMFTTSRT